MKSLKYRDKEFGVRENMLGVGKTIAELSAKYEDDLAISQYVIIRMPDYDRYQTIMNELSVLTMDLQAQTEACNKAKGKEKTKLKQIIATLQKAMQKVTKQLEEPTVRFIFNRTQNIRKEVYTGFINDLDIFKTLCQCLLTGDTNSIDFSDTSDKDLLKLRDEVFEVFFYIRTSIYR